MSQTSGGEAGSPPPAVVAAGKHSHLFSRFVEVCNILANMNSAGKVLIVKKRACGEVTEFILGEFR